MRKIIVLIIAIALIACNNESVSVLNFEDIRSKDLIKIDNSLVLINGDSFKSLFKDIKILPDSFKIENPHIRIDFIDITTVCPPWPTDDKIIGPPGNVDLFDKESIIAMNIYCLKKEACAFWSGLNNKFTCISCDDSEVDSEIDSQNNPNEENSSACSCDCPEGYACAYVKFLNGTTIYCFCMKLKEFESL